MRLLVYSDSSEANFMPRPGASDDSTADENINSKKRPNFLMFYGKIADNVLQR
jgi:hypothetical protein